MILPLSELKSDLISNSGDLPCATTPSPSPSLSQLSFRNVSYTLPSSPNPILKGVSGRFVGGQMTAIMGPSGSGKSTLIEILAGVRDPVHVTSGEFSIQSARGVLSENKRTMVRNSSQLQKTVGFVPQQPVFMRDLSVREMLSYTSELQSPSVAGEHSRARKERLRRRVGHLLHTMGLETCADTILGDGVLVKGCSGGQVKRASIAAACFAKPAVLILDEPFTGLDSRTTREIMQALQGLMAEEPDMAIVCSLHQPSKAMFAQFEMVMVLCEGAWVYQGPGGDSAGEYFYRMGYKAPVGLNPADGMMDVLGNSTAAKGVTISLSADDQDDEDLIFAGRLVEGEVREIDYFACAYAKSAMATEISALLADDYQCKGENNEDGNPFGYPNSYAHDICILFCRGIHGRLNNKVLIRTILLKYVAFAIVMGSLFWGNNPNGQNGLYMEFSLLYILCAIVYLVVFDSHQMLTESRHVFVHERRAGWYRVWAYYIAFVTSSAIVSMLSVMVFACLTYVIAFHSLFSFSDFCFFVLVMLTFSFSIDGLSYMFGVYCDNSGTVSICLNCTTIVVAITAGYGVLEEDLPAFWQYIGSISIVRYALATLTVSEMNHEWYGECSFNTSSLSSSSLNIQSYLQLCRLTDYGEPRTSGTAFINAIGYDSTVMVTTSKYIGIAILFGMGMLFHTIACLGLRYRSFDKH
eukprot:Nk52_evm30s1705 gene=Nk52_evmTU30s1705